jgi:hypothetical protein
MMKQMLLLAAASTGLLCASATWASDPGFGDPTQTKSVRLQVRLPRVTTDPLAPGTDPTLVTVGPDFLAPSPTVFGNQPHSDSRVIRSFSGIGDYDTRLLGRALAPPDTMGAVGTTQFVQLINGGFAVFDKGSGNLLGATSDNGFWNQLGQIGTGGDPRILFDEGSSRWIAIGFGANTKDINIAVSKTADALGDWQATRFEGLAQVCAGCSTIADYPTLAMDNSAIYIGTNNFRQETPGGANAYRGTTLFVLNKANVFDGSGPSLAGMQAFNTPFVSGSPDNDTTRGFAIQGVNSNESNGTGHVVAASAFVNGVVAYDILNAASGAAFQTASVLVESGYGSNNPARQPGRTGNPPLRNIDTLDDRIGSNAWEQNGKTYYVHTVTPIDGDGSILNDYSRVRLTVMESTTKAVLQTLDIGAGQYDFYQGSLAVSEKGLVIAYNRSGYDPETGKIGIFANIYTIKPDGTVVQKGAPVFVKDSVSPGYLNGAPEITGTPQGRQRWGDYSAVTLDPTDDSVFWLIGQFADQAYEVSRSGYPTASGFSRWGQWIAAIDVNGTGVGVVPEPATWATMLLGFGVIGFAARRRRSLDRVQA